MPHYFATGLNEIIGNGIADTVRGLVALLTLILTGFEETIFFVIEYYLGTISCLVDALVHGVLKFSEYAINETVGFVNIAMQGTLKSLDDTVQDVGTALNTLARDLSYLGVGIPSVSGIESDLSGLSSVTKINATEIVGGIEVLSDNIPPFENLKSVVQEVIAVPFDRIKTLLK